MPTMMRHLTVIARCATQYRTEKLAPLGLKGNHGSYLLQICKDPGLTQDRLARRLYIDKSNVARQLAVLEEQGYVRREACPHDKRILRVYPTDKATEALPQIRQVLREWETLVTQDLGEEAREELTQILALVRNRAAQWVEEG